MSDCKVVITVRDDIVHIEGADTSLEDLARISGFLQVFVAAEALKDGLGMEDVKNNMLDIHLAAMETVEEQSGKGGPDGGEEKAE